MRPHDEEPGRSLAQGSPERVPQRPDLDLRVDREALGTHRARDIVELRCASARAVLVTSTRPSPSGRVSGGWTTCRRCRSPPRRLANAAATRTASPATGEQSVAQAIGSMEIGKLRRVPLRVLVQRKLGSPVVLEGSGRGGVHQADALPALSDGLLRLRAGQRPAR